MALDETMKKLGYEELPNGCWRWTLPPDFKFEPYESAPKLGIKSVRKKP